MNIKEHKISPQSFHVEPHEFPNYIQALKKEWANIPCGPKGEVERFLERGAGFFPDRLLIPRVILQTNDIESIRNGLLEGVSQNCSMGVRSVADKKLFGGEKLPWVMEIISENQVNDFLDRTLELWKQAAAENNYSIGQLILMFNPPEIGTRRALPNQFVARVQKDNFLTDTVWSRVLVEMKTGTNQLRGLDRSYDVSNDNVLRLEYLYGPTRFLREKTIQIGKKHFDDKAFSHIRLRHLDKKKRNLLLSALMKIDEIITKSDLPKRLDFFAGFGLNAIEFQGYVDHAGDARALIYGLRGYGDETCTGLDAYDFESRTNSD